MYKQRPPDVPGNSSLVSSDATGPAAAPGRTTLVSPVLNQPPVSVGTVSTMAAPPLDGAPAGSASSPPAGSQAGSASFLPTGAQTGGSASSPAASRPTILSLFGARPELRPPTAPRLVTEAPPPAAATPLPTAAPAIAPPDDKSTAPVEHPPLPRPGDHPTLAAHPASPEPGDHPTLAAHPAAAPDHPALAAPPASSSDHPTLAAPPASSGEHPTHAARPASSEPAEHPTHAAHPASPERAEHPTHAAHPASPEPADYPTHAAHPASPELADHPMHAAHPASPEPAGNAHAFEHHAQASNEPGEHASLGSSIDHTADDRRDKAEIHQLVQSFRGHVGHWVAQLSAASSHAAQGIEHTVGEQTRAVEQYAAQHRGALHQHFAAQRTAAAAELIHNHQQLAAEIQRQSQQVQSHATQQTTAVAQDSLAKQAAITQSAASQSVAATAAGASHSQRVYTTLSTQASGMAQRGAAAAGSYGGGENGHAQGVAAQDVAHKGQSAIQHPGPAIAVDVNQSATLASQKITTTGQRATSRLQAELPATQQRIHGVARATTAGMSRMNQRGAQQLAENHGKVMAGLQRKEGEAVTALDRQTSATRAALASAAARHRKELAATTHAATGKLHGDTAGLANAAARGRDPRTVAAALEHARSLIGGNIERFVGRIQGGAAGFQSRAAQSSAAAQQHLAQGAQAAQGQAQQITAQGNAAGQKLTAHDLAHATQGTGQATQVITQEATQAQTRHQHVAQLTTAHFVQATSQTSAKLGTGVDQTTTQNEAHVGGQVTTGMASAAAQVGADHDKSLLDKVIDFFKSAWDWVSSVAKAVASVVVDFLVFSAGAILQIVSDALGGLLDPLLDRIGSDEFQRGRDAGDRIAAFLVGAALIIAGITTLGGGLVISVAEEVGTGGFGTPVVIVQDAVLVTVGVGEITTGIVMMASGGTPGNNQAQNRQFRAAVQEGEREIGRKLTKDEIRRVHDEISGQNYSYHEIVDLIVSMFGK